MNESVIDGWMDGWMDKSPSDKIEEGKTFKSD